jgi:hypothetical protein
MPVVMDLKFNSMDTARQWYSLYNWDANCLANPAYIADGTESRIEMDFAPRKLPPDSYTPPPPGWRFFEAVSQANLLDTVAGGAVRPFYTPARIMNPLPPLPVSGVNGDIGYCFDPDPSLRGRYKRGPQFWALDNVPGQPPAQPIVEKLWPDSNHIERVLEIILGSWFQNRPTPHPGSTPHKGWATTGPSAVPPVNDWRNVTITLDMRCKNLELGPWTKICQHVQGLNRRLTWAMPQSITFTALPANDDFVFIGGVQYTFKTAAAGPKQVQIGSTIPLTIDNLVVALGATAGLSATEITAIQRAKYSRDGNKFVVATKTWPSSDGSREFKIAVKELTSFGVVSEPQAFPNYIFTKQLISDQLGFGVNSWGKKNRVSKVWDSGRVQVVLQLTPSDSDWDSLGSVEQPLLKYYNYVVAPVAEILQDLVGNSYMLAVHPRPQADGTTFSPTVAPSESERISGKIMIYGIKVEIP